MNERKGADILVVRKNAGTETDTENRKDMGIGRQKKALNTNWLCAQEPKKKQKKNTLSA